MFHQITMQYGIVVYCDWLKEQKTGAPASQKNLTFEDENDDKTVYINIFNRSPSASERFYISLQPHFSVPVFCFLLQFVGTNLEPNLNQIFLCVSFAFCCNLWDLNFIFQLLLFAAICSILDYSKKNSKTKDFKKTRNFNKQQI